MVTRQRTHWLGRERWRGNGLSSEDVSERVRGGLTNLVSDASSRSLWDILRANVLQNQVHQARLEIPSILFCWRGDCLP
jgi:hypothetical protein